MGNVLDLKNPAEAGDVGSTTDISAPARPNDDGEQVSDETGRLSADDFISAMLSDAEAPRSVSWESDATLKGGALRKHYIAISALAAAGGLIALWQASLTALFVTLVGAGALEVRQRWGRPVRVSVDEHGIDVDGQHYPHADVASYDIHTMPDGAAELSLHAGKWHMPHLRFPLGEQDSETVHAVLARYIPRERHQIPLLHYLIRKP